MISSASTLFLAALVLTTSVFGAPLRPLVAPSEVVARAESIPQPVARAVVDVQPLRRRSGLGMFSRRSARLLTEREPETVEVPVARDKEPQVRRHYPRRVYAEYYEKREPQPEPVSAPAPAPVVQKREDRARVYPRRVYYEHYEKREPATKIKETVLEVTKISTFDTPDDLAAANSFQLTPDGSDGSDGNTQTTTLLSLSQTQTIPAPGSAATITEVNIVSGTPTTTIVTATAAPPAVTVIAAASSAGSASVVTVTASASSTASISAAAAAISTASPSVVTVNGGSATSIESPPVANVIAGSATSTAAPSLVTETTPPPNAAVPPASVATLATPPSDTAIPPAPEANVTPTGDSTASNAQPPIDPSQPPVGPSQPPVDPSESQLPVDPSQPPVDPSESQPPVDPSQQPPDPSQPSGGTISFAPRDVTAESPIRRAYSGATWASFVRRQSN